jgi:hypothetical protein
MMASGSSLGRRASGFGSNDRSDSRLLVCALELDWLWSEPLQKLLFIVGQLIHELIPQAEAEKMLNRLIKANEGGGTPMKLLLRKDP